MQRMLANVISESTRKALFLVMIFASFFLTNPAHVKAFALYEDGNCYYSYDYGDKEQFAMVVRTIGDVCRIRCENECGAFSRVDGYNELNQDVIDRCIPICRSGNKFSSKVKIRNKDPYGEKYQLVGPYSTATQCSAGSTAIDSAGNNTYESDIVVSKNEKINIKLLFPPGFGSNEILMCGKESISLDPVYSSMEFPQWDLSASQAIWNTRDTTPNTWNARNSHLTDTGIDVKDGDYLSITYSSEYRYQCGTNSTTTSGPFGIGSTTSGGSAGTCVTSPGDNDLFVRKPNNPPPTVNNFTSGVSSNWWEDLASPANQSYLFTLPGSSLEVIQTNANGVPVTDPVKVLENNEKVKWFGLNARAFQLSTAIQPPPGTPDNWTVFNNGTTDITRSYRVQSFSGILDGFSQRWTRLGVKHYDPADWNNNVGGQGVKIDWRGCIYTNGQRLQYGLGLCTSNCDVNDPDSLPVYDKPNTWFDLSDKILLEYDPVTMPAAGKLFFRIKPLPYEVAKAPNCPSSHPICQDSKTSVANKYSPANTHGQYFISIERENAEDLTSNVVSKIVTIVRQYLFGKPGESGTVQYLFNRFVADSAMVDAIRALLVLYIAYTGLSFMAGIAQFTQKEGITRLLKIGVVVALLSPNSWEFFNTYLFQLFTDGGLELIAKFTTGPGATPETFAKIEDDPALLFTIFDRPFGLLFGKVIWLKATALMMSTFLGFILAIVLVVSAITYAICMAKATLIYLVSLIGIAILLILAPLFISFALFQFTKQMFDAWWKQLLSFVFQPLLVLTAIGILNNLLLIGVYTSFGFTACESCFLGMTLPVQAVPPKFDNICLIPGMIALIGAHSPPGAVLMSPLTLVGSVFYFMIIAQAMYAFCDFGVRIANTIVTGSFVGVELSQPASNVATTPFSWARDAVTYTLGIDQQARAKRKNIIEGARSTKEAFTFKRAKPPTKPGPGGGGTPPPGGGGPAGGGGGGS